MRISRIELSNFRAFPGPCTFDLHGKNLLLYGENGSGKSSLARALDEFFNVAANARDFADFQNIYVDPQIEAGHVKLVFDDGMEYSWSPASARPAGFDFTDIARRKAVLSYRDLLKTNFYDEELEERLFRLARDLLLANVEVTTAGGIVRTVGELWGEVKEAIPKRNHPSNVDRLLPILARFQAGFRATIAIVEKQAQAFLEHFVGQELKISLAYTSGTYDKERKAIQGDRLEPHVSLRGKSLEENRRFWNDFLNEANLSALALSIYLAAALERARPQRSGHEPFRLLVLDDVLIGLDMANRLPVLEILKEHFRDWQIILITYDRAWYELARQRLPGWKHAELYRAEVGPYHYSVVLNADDHLYRALRFLEEGQIHAAVIHARIKFELLLKDACTRFRIKVRYVGQVGRETAGDLWPEVKSHTILYPRAPKWELRGKQGLKAVPLRDGQAHLVNEDLVNRIDHSSKWVLNPLSHSETVAHYRREIEDAILALADLEQAIEMKANGELDRTELARWRDEFKRLLEARQAQLNERQQHE